MIVTFPGPSLAALIDWGRQNCRQCKQRAGFNFKRSIFEGRMAVFISPKIIEA